MQAMTLRLPDEVHDALRREAYESRRSMNAIILEAIERREFFRVVVGEMPPPEGSK